MCNILNPWPDTSRRQCRGVIASMPPGQCLVPLKCSGRNLQFPQWLPYTKEKMPWCPCLFKNEAYRPVVLIANCRLVRTWLCCPSASLLIAKTTVGADKWLMVNICIVLTDRWGKNGLRSTPSQLHCNHLCQNEGFEKIEGCMHNLPLLVSRSGIQISSPRMLEYSDIGEEDGRQVGLGSKD